MDVAAAVEYVDGAGPLGERWGSVVLVRNRRNPPESEQAYDMVPIVDVQVDDAAHDVELVAERPVAGQRVDELKAREVADRLRDLMPARRDWKLFATDEAGDHLPIVEVYAESGLDALMFMQWFEGYESESVP